MAQHLLRQGCNVVTFDNLSTGHRAAVLGNELVIGYLPEGETKSRQALNWQPARDGLDDIIEDAWHPETTSTHQSL